jgi:hypothetical protein
VSRGPRRATISNATAASFEARLLGSSLRTGSQDDGITELVMPGLVPGIHVFGSNISCDKLL